MDKQQSFFHKVTENGNLEVQIATEYLKDGEVVSVNYSSPMSPASTENMDGWDDISKAIVEAVMDSKVVADFNTEKQKPTGNGVEQIITYEREIEKDGKIAVFEVMRIFDDGKEVSKKLCLSWIMPGDDPSGNDVMSRAVAEKLHTPEVIAAYEAKIAEIGS